MIMGLITADSGRVTMDGADVTALPMYQRARLGVGYLPQENSIFRGMSVWDNVMAVAELTEDTNAKRKELTESLLEELQIARLAKQNANSLSGGERRRVEIARALASRPNFMLLDEPFTGIDPLAVSDISDLVRYLKGRGLGVLITDHQVRETLEIVDRASIIYDGKVLFEGTPSEVLTNEDVRRVYLGARFIPPSDVKSAGYLIGREILQSCADYAILIPLVKCSSDWMVRAGRPSQPGAGAGRLEWRLRIVCS